MFADPHVLHRRLVREIPHPGLERGVFRCVAPPATLRDTPGDVRRHPPRKGEHTIEILEELGLREGRIQELLAKGVVQQMGGDGAEPAIAAQPGYSGA